MCIDCVGVGVVIHVHILGTIWVDTNLTYLLNRSKFINPNMTCLLNGSLMSARLSYFIKAKKKYKKKNLVLI